MENKIRLSGIIYESLSNGEGLRRVYFSQGCSLKCKGCFNPETHSKTGGKLEDMDYLIKDVLSNSMIKGVTFSGGEPTEQADKFAYMAKELRKNGLNIWCYSGYTFEELMERCKYEEALKELLENVDILVDGRFDINKKDEGILFRGSKNQRIINLQESLRNGKVVLSELS